MWDRVGLISEAHQAKSQKTKAPHEGALVVFRSLSFSLSRWFTGGFPPTSARLSKSNGLEVPVCADTLILCREPGFASRKGDYLAEFFTALRHSSYSYFEQLMGEGDADGTPS
jgi:hypothetical protein